MEEEKVNYSYHRWNMSSSSWKKIKHLARENRRNQTEAERKLWNELRAHKLNGLKFRRQHALSKYIVDFYCHEKRLIIEVDGEIHDDQKEGDLERQKFIEESGFKVLRFTNYDVLNKIEQVKIEILKCCLSIKKFY